MSENEEVKIFKKVILWIVVLLLTIGGIQFFFNRTVKTVDNAFIHYEEFQDINNTCIKLNTDLCNMKSIPETDVMFLQFSKAQRINTIKTNLNRWVEEYNSKSKMWNRSLWKSSELPYQLDINSFNCY